MTTTAIRQGYVDCPDGQIHYRAAGQGDPLILLHQSPSSSAMWEAVLPGFADRGFQAVALDMPGFGESYVPPAPPDLAYYARNLAAAVENLGITEFKVVGHHTGVSVALRMACDFPDRVRKLALWGIPLLPAERMQSLATEEPPTYGDDGKDLTWFWERRAKMSGPDVSTRVRVRCMIEMLQTYEHRPWGHNAVGKADHEALLKGVSQPVLAMCGDRDLKEATEAGSNLLKNAEFYCFPDAGLDIADDRPDDFVAKVAGFLEGVFWERASAPIHSDRGAGGARQR